MTTPGMPEPTPPEGCGCGVAHGSDGVAMPVPPAADRADLPPPEVMGALVVLCRAAGLSIEIHRFPDGVALEAGASPDDPRAVDLLKSFALLINHIAGNP